MRAVGRIDGAVASPINRLGRRTRLLRSFRMAPLGAARLDEGTDVSNEPPWPSPERMLAIAHAARDLATIIRDSVPTTDLFSTIVDEDADFGTVQDALARLIELVYPECPFDFVPADGEARPIRIVGAFPQRWPHQASHSFRLLWKTLRGLAVYFGRCQLDPSGGGVAVPSLTSWLLGPDGYERTLERVAYHPPLPQMSFDAKGRLVRADDGLDVRWLDDLAGRSARLEAAVLAVYTYLAPGGQSGGAHAAVTHADDFKSVKWGDATYTFTAMQAACVKVLWEHWERQTPRVGEQTILEAAGSAGSRLRDVFDKGKHSAWGTMIVSDGKGAFRLADPKKI
jgi:hypothetical protein